MKIYSFGCRPYDEMGAFEKYGREFGVDVSCTKQALSLENVALAKGADYVSVLTSPVTAPLLEALKDMGVKMIGTRTVGYDHIDCVHAKKIGIKVSNSAYSPDAVAEFTVMLMLMALRNMKRVIQRFEINDFTLKGLRGENLSERRVGVIGMGSIGQRVIELLRGFGCEICAYDPSHEDEPGVKFLSLEELFRTCDIITLHAPLKDNTRHIINRDSLALMPEGSVIINTARGALIDTAALIDALRSGKLAACGLDVIEDEAELYYYNRKSDIINNEALSILRDMPNVVLTHHLAFYTGRSVDDMVRNCLLSFIRDSRGEENPFRIV